VNEMSPVPDADIAPTDDEGLRWALIRHLEPDASPDEIERVPVPRKNGDGFVWLPK
jgi:hypothetical protein